MPLPDNVELQDPQTKEWPLIPADVYQAEITDIEYKAEPNRYKKYDTDPDEKQYMNFTFTIIEEGPLYGRKVWQKMSMIKPYPPKQNGKATWVYRLATAMAGHPITKGEADKFTSSDINDYIHRQVRVNIIQSAPDNNGKVWNNIDGFMTAKQQLPPFDEKKVPKENLADPVPAAQPATLAPLPESAQPVAQAPEVSPAKSAMQRGMEKHQVQQSADDIDVSDIPF
jgi:hypothetical protein